MHLRFLFLVFSFVAIACALTAHEVVYLTWNSDPCTCTHINWLTDDKTLDNLVQYKKQQSEAWQKKEGHHRALGEKAPHNVHRVELEELEPDTIYSFQLPGEKESRLFRTMPKSLQKGSVSFAVGGDLFPGELDLFEEMAKEVAAKSPRFALLGGDLAYSVTNKMGLCDDFSRWWAFLKSWSAIMKDEKGCHIPLVATIGNHETLGYFDQTPEQAKFFYALVSPQGYRALLCGDYLVLVLLDSNHTHPIAGAQTDWLKETLSRSLDYAHCFAIYHVPAYPSVRYFRLPESCSIRRHWVPLFERYFVSAAFENHDHAYKRTYPLIDGSPSPKGVVYFGDGCWGAKPRIPKRASRTSYLAKTASKRQFLWVELTEDKRTYQAITPHNHVIDSYEQYVGKPSAIP